MTFSFAAKKKITLFQRTVLMESIGVQHVGGVVKAIKRMLFGTLIIEGVGAILLAIRFVPMFGVGQGIWYGIFHSISAFCNAGFDLMGQKSPGSSLTLVADDPVILTTIMVLITTGGIGFIVWSDICDNRLNFKKYALHTKIMVTFTIGLILFGAVLFLMLENNAVLAGMLLYPFLFPSE